MKINSHSLKSMGVTLPMVLYCMQAPGGGGGTQVLRGGLTLVTYFAEEGVFF